MSEMRVDEDKRPDRPDDSSPDESSPSFHSEEKKIRRKDILNLLNFVNFQEGSIFAQFKHNTYNEALSLQALPRPCTDELLECRWMRTDISPQRLKDYAFDSFLLSDGQGLFRVKAELTELDTQKVVFKIPDFGHEKSARKIRRHECADIDAELLQNGTRVAGRLIDFSAVSCRIELRGATPLQIRWINPEAPVTLLLRNEAEIFFSGECVVTRYDTAALRRCLVLTPHFNNIRRYRAREFRSQRQTLSPVPNVSFTHPLTGRRMDLQALDISSSGLAVEEFFYNSTLLPGLVIPEITVEIGNRLMMRCRAQVLYRNVEIAENGDNLVRCGFVFLDLSISDQSELSALLHQSTNNRLRVCNRVDMEELWRFFFETGFIYPSKYLSIESDKASFKKTYEKLYLRSPGIARHFIFQDRGVVFGHMSMLRNHAETWLIHHHAADRSGYGMAGVAVLDQVGRYINEFHLHHSTHMDFVMCYYRKENRFPSRVFGGVAHDLNDPKGSSIDAFAYLHLKDVERDKTESYQIFPAHRDDLIELSRFYENASGGLSIEALNLIPDTAPENELDREYELNGFNRGRAVFSFKQGGILKAVIMITLTELGLNLSNLSNCVHVFVVHPEKLLPKTLFSGISDICEHYEKMEIPVLVYPSSYLDDAAVAYSKKYILWVLNMKNSDGYFKSLHNTFRRVDLGNESNRRRNE